MSKRAIIIFSILFIFVLGLTTATNHYFIHPPPNNYLGNSNSHIFHTENCSAASKIKEINKIYFDCISDALDQGYRPCKVCNPK